MFSVLPVFNHLCGLSRKRATLSVLDISFTNWEWVLLICEKMSSSS